MPSAIAAEVVGLADAARAGADADLLALEPVGDHSLRSSSRGQPLEVVAAQLGLEHARQRDHRRAGGAPQAPQLGVLGAGAAVLGEGGAQRGARGPRAASRRRRSRALRTSSRAEALPGAARSPRSGPRPCRARRAGCARTRSSRSPGISSGQRDRQHPRRASGRAGTVDLLAPGGPPVPRARRSRRCAARAASRAPWPVAGASTIARSNAAPPGARLELGEVPDLADRHQLGEAGRGGREVLEQAAAAEHARPACATSAGSAAIPPWPARDRRTQRSSPLGERARDRLPSCALLAPPRTRTMRLPRRAATSPRAAATVVLPTPPLPVTSTSRLSSSEGTGREG